MEEQLRKCGMCKLDIPENDENFASRQDRGKKEFQSNCRNCQKEYRRQHYLNNKQKYIDKAKVYRDNVIDWFTDIKKELKCGVCGEDRYWVLDFHHRDPNEKDLEVSTLVRNCHKEKILLEISKCDVLCSNCHRDLHFREKEINKLPPSFNG